MMKATFSLCAALVLSFAEPSAYISNVNSDVLKVPSSSSVVLRTLKQGETIYGEVNDGYIGIVDGYVSIKNLTPIFMVEEKNKSGKSMKAIIETTFSTKEIPISYLGLVKGDRVNVRDCSSVRCNSKEYRNRGELVNIVAKTEDGGWVKTDRGGYIASKYITLQEKSIEKKEDVSELIKSKITQTKTIKHSEVAEKHQLPAIEEISLAKEPIIINTTEPEKTDELLAHSGELAKKYQNEALVKNLTKTATPLPVKIPARYARALDLPILNKDGDVYYDYTYAWIKIKDEEFVLGKREGKASSGNGQFTIHKKIN